MNITKKELQLLTDRKISKRELSELDPTSEALVYSKKYKNMEIIYIYYVKELLYLDNQPKITIFMEEADFISYLRNRDNSTTWSAKNIVDLFFELDGVSYSTVLSKITKVLSTSKISYASSKDFFETVRQKQADIKANLLTKRHEKIKAEIDNKMKEVPKIPAGFEKWINKTGMSKKLFMENNFIYYKKEGTKFVDAYCTACDTKVSISQAKHNDKGTCPNCKRPITFKAEGRFKKHSEFDSWYLIQKTKKDEILVRFFRGTKFYDDHYKNPLITYKELTRVFINQSGESSIYSFDYFLSTSEIRWRQGIRGTGLFKARYSCELEYSTVYNANLKQVFKNTVWEYFNYSEKVKINYVHPARELATFAKNPQIEYLTKMGLSNLETQLFNSAYYCKKCDNQASTAHEFLRVPKKYMSQLISLNPDFETLEYFVAVKEILSTKNKLGVLIEPNFTNEEFFAIRDFLPNISDMKRIVKEISLTKFYNYVNKQKIQHLDRWKEIIRWGKIDDKRITQEIISHWLDYRRIAKEVELQFAKKGKAIAPFEVLPQNLIDRHDEVTVLKDEENLKEKSKIIKQLHSNWEKFNYIDEETGLFLTYPKDAFEMVNESNKLQHCVKTYIDSVCKKQTNIFFVRDINKPNEPLYTMEFRDDRIIQFRGIKNRAVSDLAEQFKEKWLNTHLPSVGIQLAK